MKRLLTLVAILCATTAHAATTHVNPGGSIQAAVNAAMP